MKQRRCVIAPLASSLDKMAPIYNLQPLNEGKQLDTLINQLDKEITQRLSKPQA